MSGILQYTFRSHHNAYSEGDGSGATILRHPQRSGLIYKVIQIVFGLVMIHYFLYFIPMLYVLWVPYHWGHPLISVGMLALYLRTYYQADELKLGRPWEAFRQLQIWKLLQEYGELELVREAELDPNRKYIFGFHPHGILILSRTCTYAGVFETLFPGIQQRCLAATPMFNHPGSREMCLWLGAVRADKSNAVRILSTSNLSLFLYPGGSDEIFETDPDSPQTVIIARKGFIKLALQQGCDLVPTFVFGEKHFYHKLEIPQGIKNFFMKKLRTPLLIFWGRFFTWLPLKGPKTFISIVFGKAIRIERPIPEPTDEEIDSVYERFYGDIRNLYDKYKSRYGYPESETLVIREAKAHTNTKNLKTEKIKSKNMFENRIKEEKGGRATKNKEKNQ